MDQSFPGCCFVNKMCLVFVKKLHLCKYLSYEMRCLVVSNYRHKLCLAFFFVMIREKTKQNKTKQKQKVIFFRTFRVELAFRRRKKLNSG